MLGAGNCNDLDLSRLARFYSEIHLIDLDGEALLAGAARQPITSPSELYLHGGIDVTGTLTTLSKWRSGQLNQETLDRGICRARDFVGLPFLGSFHTVVSTCLLTQLLDSVTSLSSSGRLPFGLLRALRLRHLGLLAELLSPGGTGILVSDFSSSDIVPNLADAPRKALTGLMDELIRHRLHFSGTNPRKIRSLLETDPQLSSWVDRVQVTQPWLWDLTPERCFIVCAVQFRRQEREKGDSLLCDPSDIRKVTK